jgi:hypothetical protein
VVGLSETRSRDRKEAAEMETELMTTREVRAFLRSSAMTIHRLRRRGLLRAYQLPTGGKNMYRRKDVEALVLPAPEPDSKDVAQ